MTSKDQNAPAGEGQAGTGSRFLLYILAAAFAAIAGFGSVAISLRLEQQNRQTAAPAQASPAKPADASAEAADMTKLVYAVAPKDLPPGIAFQDEAGQPRSLADWKGKIVLMNLWATWCAPCKLEMPGLDRLQAQLGGADFAVLAISLDRNGKEAPRRFLADNKLTNLPLHIDETGTLANKIGAAGLPATLILDREGREIARMLGPAEWDSASAQDVIRAAIAGKPRS